MILQYQQLAQIQTSMPPRIMFSAPVVLRDPFNLEFIDCWESLFSVLQNLFRDGGAKKIERKEFHLEKRSGDNVDMAMLIRSLKSADKVVGPSCIGTEGE